MSGSIASLQADLASNLALLNTNLSVAQLVTVNAQILNDQNQLIALGVAPICFAKGTSVLTDRGEVLIENLKIGDLVVTPYAEADCMPVRWIGRQHYDNSRVQFGQPILVRVGALGDGLPHRDLRVSADHSLFFDGHLVPARLLVNCTTIMVDATHTEMDYYNIEFECHTIVLAEGIEVESYLDCGNRARFDNAQEQSEWLSTRTHRDGSAWVNGCAFAPLMWEGPILAALRQRINEHAINAAAIPAFNDVEPIFVPSIQSYLDQLQHA